MTALPLPVIAIDGPVASGKSTLARKLAAHFGFDHLNTGLLYRAVGWKLNQAGLSAQNVDEAVKIATSLTPDDLLDPALTGAEAGQLASKIATAMPVREALIAYQRNFCASPPNGRGAVLDGRDITTFIWPQAQARLFVTASEAARADRRLAELLEKQRIGLLSGTEPATHAAVLADNAARDQRDAANTPYTLKIAPGVYVLDTTFLNVAATLTAAVQYVMQKTVQAA